ncbi:MAG: NADH-quinone oxidoreductase subunit M [Gomphosphaeria aponina SAG 52.96 = DSM 107014]|uniref:NADH-quinone oxidoreductase subunit M n=1 Tax=Gomphosphaeria aponina SAG 52.96 = DSM 107014 TaxID=1521640 RepID=A0A941JT73_9CHRO|nr:NADH-quinone oxidoreductase subunit M [Gomphosphaeria aponina SAG 52.96 = DSM 107014]
MLSILIWFPIIGAAIISFLPVKLTPSQSRLLASGIGGATFFWTLFLVSKFNYQGEGIQLSEFLPWLEFIGLNYNIGVDGLSFPLVVLNTFLIWTAIYSSDLEEEGGKPLQRPRLFYALMLILGGCITGALLSQNLLLFFIFYEVKLIPVYLLINIWGGENRGYAGTKYLLYTAFSGVFVLISFLGLVFLTSSTFDYQNLQSQVLPFGKQIILLVTLIIGFGIKIPLVPLHTWLPDAYTEASTPVSMILGGILSKLGTYGLIRFGLGLFPEVWSSVAFPLACVAVVSALYASLVAVAQTDLKKMVAYSSIAHIAFVVLATAAGTPLSLLGAVCQMFAHGLIVALLFNLVGIVESKTGSRDLTILKGLMNPLRGLPLTGGLMILGVMASAGIPGMVGFIGEFLSFQGSFIVFPILTLLCLVATGLTAVYFVILLNRAFFGRLDTKIAYLPKVQFSERTPAIILSILIVLLGLQPNLLTKFSERTSITIATTSGTPSTPPIIYRYLKD